MLRRIDEPDEPADLPLRRVRRLDLGARRGDQRRAGRAAAASGACGAPSAAASARGSAGASSRSRSSASRSSRLDPTVLRRVRDIHPRHREEPRRRQGPLVRRAGRDGQDLARDAGGQGGQGRRALVRRLPGAAAARGDQAHLRPRLERQLHGLFRRLCTVDLLVLDDLGAEKQTEWVLEQLYSIVNERWQDRRSIVVTTNIPDPDPEAPARMLRASVRDLRDATASGRVDRPRPRRAAAGGRAGGARWRRRWASWTWPPTTTRYAAAPPDRLPHRLAPDRDLRRPAPDHGRRTCAWPPQGA